MLFAYLICSALTFLFLSLIWNKDDMLNLLVKMVLIVHTVVGAYLVFNH